MIGAPQRRSTALAWAFMVTSISPLLAPSASPTSANAAAPGASAASPKQAANASPDAAATCPAPPRRGPSAPAIGMNETAPAASVNSNRPSSPSDSRSAPFSGAIAADQPPKPKPLAKNSSDVAARSRTGLKRDPLAPRRGLLAPTPRAGARQPPRARNRRSSLQTGDGS